MEYLSFQRNIFFHALPHNIKHSFVHIVQFGYPQLIFRFRLCDLVGIKHTPVGKK